MIVKETFYINEREFVRTYSDSGKYVVRDGVSYDIAEDPAEFNRQYTEGSEIVIEEEEPMDTENSG